LNRVIVIVPRKTNQKHFDSNGRFVTAWGSFGTSNSEFNEVTDVTVGVAGHVYVSDYGNNNVQVFGLGTNPHPTT
jgi:hypothetical protein